ncbi:MAG: phosphatidate cytidylyltransferase [Bacteroidetes bacterium]|nr:phosphatidate cytidylyltransferase [Bacteroidota bacterium]MBU1114259.1 phosphatidate cytidylyltransferase [Bacteroidota bacterium]MBU1797677.1 phosphatidate cytidylyltransferase [Bacteroidota bacterium]
MSNRVTRILVAIFTIPVLLGLTYWGGIPFLILIMAIGLTSFYEFSKIVNKKNIFTSNLVGFISITAIILNTYFHFATYEILLLILIPILLMFELFRDKESAISNISSTLLGIFYAGFFSSTIVAIREFYASGMQEYANGGFIIISILITLWMTDSAAYFIGTAFGKHKLFPRVSPKKSWEGAIAGFVFAAISLIVLKFVLLTFLNWIDIFAFTIIIGIFGQIGDLIESLIKRDADVKDSSNLIPGHGGILDRFDSLLFSAPIIYLYLILFLK